MKNRACGLAVDRGEVGWGWELKWTFRWGGAVSFLFRGFSASSPTWLVGYRTFEPRARAATRTTQEFKVYFGDTVLYNSLAFFFLSEAASERHTNAAFRTPVPDVSPTCLFIFCIWAV